jgi:DNA-binding PadR family transcriptional regulator
VVLALIGEQARHGYDIIRAIEERTGGAYAPSPGVIYPTLQLLEDLGHVAPATSTGERNNSYAITAEGRGFLKERGSLIADIMARMKQAAQRNAGRSPAIVAAMDDLKSALRSGAGTWSDAELKEIAAALEGAAGRIRRLRDAADTSST